MTMTMLLQCLAILTAVAATATAQTACQDEASCQAAAALLPDAPAFRVLATQTKGCFEKGGTVYWSTGGTEEENAKPAPGQQSRVYCEGIEEDGAADEATTTTTAATEAAGGGVGSTPGSEESAAATEAAATEAATEAAVTTEAAAVTTEAATEGTEPEGEAFELVEGVEVDELVVVVEGEEEDGGAAPEEEKSAPPPPPPPSAADGRSSRFSAYCLVLGSMWLSLAVLSC